MPAENAHRLPRTVTPNHYRLTIEPDLEAFRFEGTAAIDVTIAEPVAEIVMNAAELEVASVSVAIDGDTIATTGVVDEDRQRLTIALPESIGPGDATVHITYRGTIGDRLRGFYRSIYAGDDGVERVIASTQFEATDARRAFPCWDEPDRKATFGVTLVVADGLEAVSSAAEVSRTSRDDGRTEIVFADTVRMSTYPLAWVVGELEATEPLEVCGVPLRIVTPPGKLHLTGYALEVGAHALAYFTDYYDIPYPGDKLDMVAIPDFAWGAMENLGCITYRESALLIDEASATKAERGRVAEIIAHEIAHMWFGDLVTMKWWNGVWLNEAFATFAENKATDAFRPEWKQWLGFSTERARSQETDALATTRSIEFPVASPSEADAMFDVLTYEKGSSVLRMVEQFIGEDAFRAGVSLYLKRHAFANTDNTDLWAALEEASGQPVGEIMDTWIFQGGYPVIEATVSDGTLTLAQRQFRYLGPGDGLWQVPVIHRSSLGTVRTLVGAEPVTVPVGDDVVVNAGGDGFYRVEYDHRTAEEIVGRIGDLSATERFGIVSDTFASVLAGDAEAADYLALVSHLSGEDELPVWTVVLGGLGELDRILSSDDEPAFGDFVANLLASRIEDLGWEPDDGEDEARRALRGSVIKALGTLGRDQETIAWARTVSTTGDDVDPEILDAALAITASAGDLDDFERFLDMSKNAPTPQLTVKYLRAAASVPHPEVPERMVGMVIDGTVRTQDSFWVLALLIGQKVTGPVAWRIITERWDDVLAALPPSNAYRMMDLLHLRSEPDVAAAIAGWFATNEIPGAELVTAQRLEQLEVRVGLREREQSRIGASLDPS